MLRWLESIVDLLPAIAEAIGPLCGADPSAQPGELRELSRVQYALSKSAVVERLAGQQFVTDRDLSDETFAALSGHLNRQQLIEFCTLAGHYDAIAGILAALRVPMDFPD